MDRRQYLKGTALSVGSIGIGVIATQQLSQSAKASVEASEFNIDGDSITTRDGKINSLNISVEASWEYSIPSEKSPERWTLSLLTHRDDDESDKVDEVTDEAMYLDSSGDETLSGDVLETDLYEPEDFYSTEEGETLTSKIPFSLVFTVEDKNKEIIAQAVNQSRAPLDITNEAYNASEFASLESEGELNVTG